MKLEAYLRLSSVEGYSKNPAFPGWIPLIALYWGDDYQLNTLGNSGVSLSPDKSGAMTFITDSDGVNQGQLTNVSQQGLPEDDAELVAFGDPTVHIALAKAMIGGVFFGAASADDQATVKFVVYYSSYLELPRIGWPSPLGAFL